MMGTKAGLLRLLTMLVSLSGCTVAASHPNLRGEPGLPELTPVREFVANRASNFAYKISPDGRKLAWLAIKGVSLHIFVKDLQTDDVRTIPADKWYGFVWARDSRHLVSTASRGDETSYVQTLDVERPDDEPRIISPEKGVNGQLIQLILNDPDHVLIALNERDKSVFDLYRVDIDGKKRTSIARNPGNVSQWVIDPQGELAGRVVKRANVKTLELLRPAEAGYAPVYQWTMDDSVQVVSVTDRGAKVILLSNKGRDRVVLLELAAESGRETVLHADPVVDVSGVYTHPVTGLPIAVLTYPDYPKTTLLDRTFAAPFQLLNKKAANIGIDSTDDELRQATVTLATDKGAEFYLYDLKSNALKLLGSSPSLGNKEVLVDVVPVEIASRDKLPLHGYLALPKGVGRQRLPLVLEVHGGPWGRDYWMYDAYTQFLANRGYAVLRINYRGSTGYGRRFQELAIGQFAGKMHDDLIDAVNWAIEQGIADPAKIAIAGTSYGGYAALVGLSFTPDVFACGVDVNGPSDLEKLGENFPPYWKLEMDNWYKYVGNPASEADRASMRSKSPLFKADKINKPLLVIQGTQDVRVLKGQSLELVNRLQEQGKEVDLWLVPGAGHFLNYWPHRLKQYRKTEDFLARCLGGRSSGFDFYQLGSWLF